MRSCPDAQAFHDAVGAHVRGWEPFGVNAPWRLAISLARSALGYRGVGELRDVNGALIWARQFAPTARCIDVLEDLALALAFRIDPPRVLGPSESPLDTAPEARAPQPALPAAPSPPQPDVVALRFGANLWGDLATAPRPAVGMTVDLGFQVAWFSLAAELRWDPRAGASVMDGVDISTTRLLGGLVPCGHVGKQAAFVGCVVGEVGRVEGAITAAGVRPPDHRAVLTGALGVRLGVEIPLHRHLHVRAAADLLGALGPPRFHLDQAVVWESPAFIGGLGAGLVAPF